MIKYEYKVVPAPVRGDKVKGLKSTADKFAHALTALMNELGAAGWDYVRADTLPCEERSGLTGKVTTYQNMLVFRRVVETVTVEVPEPVPAPVPSTAEEFAEQAAASLSAAAPEGNPPALSTDDAERA